MFNVDDVESEIENIMIEKAKSYLEGLLSGVTRKSGFTKEMTDEQILAKMEQCEMYWTGTSWRNDRLQEMIRDMERDLDIPKGSLPARFIWGDE